MTKKVLIIGAANYQAPAIKRVRDLGYEAYCVDWKEGQPGFVYANGHRIIDVKDKEKCLAYAKELNIDGVLTWGATLTLPTVSYIGSNMDLPCLPMQTCEISMSKYQIRKRLTDFGLNGGEVFEFHNWDEVRRHEFKLPFVVKPSDGSGSKGVRIVQKEEEIHDAVEYAFAGARNNEIYVEPYVKGEEYSVEAFVYEGRVYIYSIVKTEFYWEKEYPIYNQTTYWKVSTELERLIEKEVEGSAKALGVTFGPINFDLIVSDNDGKPYIIDVGIRNGQNLIASHIVPYSRGVDELNLCIEWCLGNKVDAVPVRKKIISSRLLIYSPGMIKEIKPVEGLIGHDHIVDIILRKHAGEELPRYETKADICGWILTEGDTPEEARSWADKGWETLKDYIIIER